MKKFMLAAALVAITAVLAPATAGAATVRGVVVAHSHGMLLVATRTGRVVAVGGRARIGSRVVGSRVVGRAAHAKIHGVVVGSKGSTLFVSSNRHLVAIQTGRRLAGSGSSSGTAPGTIVTSTVTVQANGRLDENSESEDGQDSSSTVQVQGTVAALGAGTITLTVNGESVTLDLPAGLTLPSSLVGQTVTISVSLSQDDQGDDNQGDGDSGGGDSGSGGGDSGGGDSGSGGGG
jgi:hypothetical protein